jgi:hypothetical protein
MAYSKVEDGFKNAKNTDDILSRLRTLVIFCEKVTA